MSFASKPDRPPAEALRGNLFDQSECVRMRMSLDEARRMRDGLLESRGSLAARVIHDALWLRVVLLEHRQRLGAAEGLRFERRADRILRRLSADSQPNVPSETTITVGRNGKR